jgi:hypothetical protein
MSAVKSPDRLREELTRMVLDSPYALRREEIDYMAFWRSREWESFDRLVLGNRTFSDMVGRTKYIDSSVWPVTPTETARPYIRMIWEEQCARRQTAKSRWMGFKRVPWSRETFPMLKLNAPAFFAAPSSGDLTYVDIKAAYFQLYSVASLDLRFNPQRGVFGQGIIEFLRADELATLKETRNTITGVVRATSRKQCCHGKMEMVPTYNRFLAPELWGYLMHTLHAVALDLRERFDVRYIATDGYIVPSHEADLLREYLAEAWGLESTVKCSGPGSVWALGAYRLGERGSRSRAKRGEPVDNLLALDEDWRAKLRRWRWWLIRREFNADVRMQLAAADTLDREGVGVGEPFAPDVGFAPAAGHGKPVPTAAASPTSRLFIGSSSPARGALFRSQPGEACLRPPDARSALFRSQPGEACLRAPSQRPVITRG